MGKYMRKSKISGDVAVMEVSQSAILGGVRTRAKTLALQRLQSTSTNAETNPDVSSFSYLQLRSRRLEKPPLLYEARKMQQGKEKPQPKRDPSLSSKGGSRPRMSSVKSGGDCEEEKARERCFGEKGEMSDLKCETEDLGVEPSFGDNYLDFEVRERSTRESTPCSFIRESGTIGTPGSTTRQTASTATNRRVRNDFQRNIPTTREMEEFFTYAEQEQQRMFMDKYNYDVVNDLPLPGRYEWVQVMP